MALFSSLSAPLTAAPLQGVASTMLWLEISICIMLLGSLVALVATHFYTIPTDQFSADDFERLGCSMANIPRRGSARIRLRRYKGHFGANPQVVASLWMKLAQSGWLSYAGFRGPKPQHLLWCLLWLKGYAVEEVSAAQMGTSEKTFRKWVWFYAEGIANLDSDIVSNQLCWSSKYDRRPTTDFDHSLNYSLNQSTSFLPTDQMEQSI